VTPSNPIHQNDRIIIYATGLGAVSPPVADGVAGPTDPLAVTTAAPTVTIGGVTFVQPLGWTLHAAEERSSPCAC